VPAARLSTSEPSVPASDSAPLATTLSLPFSRSPVTGPEYSPKDDSVSVIVSGLTIVNE